MLSLSKRLWMLAVEHLTNSLSAIWQGLTKSAVEKVFIQSFLTVVLRFQMKKTLFMRSDLIFSSYKLLLINTWRITRLCYLPFLVLFKCAANCLIFFGFWSKICFKKEMNTYVDLWEMWFQPIESSLMAIIVAKGGEVMRIWPLINPLRLNWQDLFEWCFMDVRNCVSD